MSNINYCDEFETYHKSVFKNIALDTIMKKCNISEGDAENVFNKLRKEIFILDKECLTPTNYYSIRYAITNRINKM